MGVIGFNDCPPEPAIEWDVWLDNELLDVLGNNDAYTFECIWENLRLRKLACQYMLVLGHNRINIVRLDTFYREFATCGETLGQQARALLDGNVTNDDALDMALFAPKQARDTWPEMVRHKADQLRAEVLRVAPDWHFVKNAYADACDKAEQRARCVCRFNGDCVCQ